MTTRTLPVSHHSPAQLSHVVLRTAHLDQSAAWYEAVLGAYPVWHDSASAALTFDSEHHRVALIAVPPLADSATPGRFDPGAEHIAFKLGGLGELLSRYVDIRERQITPQISLNHIATVSLYYRDPDGVMIELFCDALTPDQATEVMNTEQFNKNPIGVPFDPDDLVKRYLDGEPITSLVAQPELDQAGSAALAAYIGGGEVEIPVA